MKKNYLKSFFSSLTVLSLLLMVGCTQQQSVNAPDSESSLQEKKTLTFRILLPKGDPIIYTRADAIHDKPEWTVNSLTLYQFSSDDKLLSTTEIPSTDLSKTADAVYLYTKEFGQDDLGVYKFYFVANDKIEGVQEGISLDAFKALQFTQKLKEDGTSTSKDLLVGEFIPMSGVARQGTQEEIALSGTSSAIDVTLTRVVARVDVANHIPNLNITSISLLNTYDRSSLFPTENFAAPSDAKKVATASGFADLPDPFYGVAGNEGAVLKKALYLYEGQQPTDAEEKANATTIVIKATRKGGQEFVFKVPFVKSSEEYIPVHVKRNHLYTLVLGDDSPLEENSKLKFKIEVADWNTVTLNQEILPITIESLNAEGYIPTRWYQNENKIITANGWETLKFSLRTIYYNHKAYNVKFISPQASADKFEAKIDGSTLSIDLKFLPTDGQPDLVEAEFQIWSDAAPDHPIKLTVIRDDKFNP